MSTAITKTAAAIETWNPEQRALIKRTVAPTATDDELAMFLHVAAVSGLDPLRKQIHFIKVQNRVVFIADVNGLQARAAKEADYEGILHAVVYEKDDFSVDNTTGQVLKHTSNPLCAGRIIGAWATVRRRGMLPFTVVVRFAEYDNANNALWKSKPAVMIDKCAKSTALRIAYPEQLGNLYDEAELGKEEVELNPPPPPGGTQRERTKEKLQKKLAALAPGAKPAPPPEEPPAPEPEPEATGKLEAPAEASPRTAREPDADEEIVTPFMRFARVAAANGLSTFQLTQKAQAAINKSSGFTHADIDQLEAALGAVAK